MALSFLNFNMLGLKKINPRFFFFFNKIREPRKSWSKKPS